jgi:hypothetical protein
MTPLDAMYAASMVTFAPRSFEGRNPYATIRYVDLSARAPASPRKLRLNEGAANDGFFS